MKKRQSKKAVVKQDFDHSVYMDQIENIVKIMENEQSIELHGFKVGILDEEMRRALPTILSIIRELLLKNIDIKSPKPFLDKGVPNHINDFVFLENFNDMALDMLKNKKIDTVICELEELIEVFQYFIASRSDEKNKDKFAKPGLTAEEKEAVSLYDIVLRKKRRFRVIDDSDISQRDNNQLLQNFSNILKECKTAVNGIKKKKKELLEIRYFSLLGLNEELKNAFQNSKKESSKVDEQGDEYNSIFFMNPEELGVHIYEQVKDDPQTILQIIYHCISKASESGVNDQKYSALLAFHESFRSKLIKQNMSIPAQEGKPESAKSHEQVKEEIQNAIRTLKTELEQIAKDKKSWQAFFGRRALRTSLRGAFGGSTIHPLTVIAHASLEDQIDMIESLQKIIEQKDNIFTEIIYYLAKAINAICMGESTLVKKEDFKLFHDNLEDKAREEADKDKTDYLKEMRSSGMSK